MRVLLRILTHKSQIKFGIHSDLTVQNLIDLQKHDYLIWMYYNMDLIDFSQELKEELRLAQENRLITKPGKNFELFCQIRGKILWEIIEFGGYYDQDNPNRFFNKHQRMAERKTQIISNCIRQNKEKSKIRNRDRNQKH